MSNFRISLHVLDSATLAKILAKLDLERTKRSYDVTVSLEQNGLPPNHKITYDKRYLELLDELEGGS